MPIKPDAVGARSGPARRTWSSRDSLLYALGVGAGAADPLGELEFTTDNTAGTPQRALPTQGVVLAPFAGALDPIGEFNPAMLVHGEQGITLHRELPVAGELEAVNEITGIYDKGKGAVVVLETRATLVETGEPLFDTRMSVFIRGEGGWGGDRGPSGDANAAPDREPDVVVDVQTRHDQALLYRLNGDRNPLHSDPAFAARGGFERPILHGLCTYGFTGRALLHTLCDGDPARFRSMDARFSSPVLPGERLTVRAWRVGDASALFQTLGSDGRVVIDAGRVEIGESA